MTSRDPLRFWQELQRRRVVRSALLYVAGAWVLAQAASLVLEAFDAAHYMRFIIAALIAGLPIAVLLAWMFDLTPAGIERTAPLEVAGGSVPQAPERSIAVLPFVNLSADAGDEYFSDGLAEEIRNRLAREPDLRVAARTSSFAFKGKHEDVRDIGRRLNVATLLEGGVRRQADTVRIDVQLVGAADGYQVWSRSFERRLDDIFRLQSEVADAVLAAVKPGPERVASAPLTPATTSFDAYNLYLLGRHHFHKRTEASLRRAVDCFERAIAIDDRYALAYSGLADAYSLSSTSHYGNMPAVESLAKALPAALRALELAPELAEAHASLGFIRYDAGDLTVAESELRRALEINPGYPTAHIWYGLVLNAEGRYRDAADCNREAHRLDPLSPIVNANLGFDALRFGDDVEAEARFAAAIEIDPTFPVPYSGMAKLASRRGQLESALEWTGQAIERAPLRAFYRGRKGLLLLQLGQVDAAVAAIDEARRISPEHTFGADLVVASALVRGDRNALERIASGADGPAYGLAQRAAAWLGLGALDAARVLYGQESPDPEAAVADVLNDAWVWRLPHVLNHARLMLDAGDARGAETLERLLAAIDALAIQGIRHPELTYWAAGARALLGQRAEALDLLEEAVRQGWRHGWWARTDWTLRGLADDARFAAAVAAG